MYQTHDTPPATRIVDATGRTVAELTKSDLTKFNELGLKKAEMFTYKAADGKTTLRGLIQFPSTFDPSKKYPVLVPAWRTCVGEQHCARNVHHAQCDCRVRLSRRQSRSRAAPGMGKRTLDSIYLKLGQVEIDDMAEGVKALGNRPYVDRSSSASTARRKWLFLRHVDPAHPGAYAAASRRRRSRRESTTSTPSATCGFRRRTRKATTRAAP